MGSDAIRKALLVFSTTTAEREEACIGEARDRRDHREQGNRTAQGNRRDHKALKRRSPAKLLRTASRPFGCAMR